MKKALSLSYYSAVYLTCFLYRFSSIVYTFHPNHVIVMYVIEICYCNESCKLPSIDYHQFN